MKVRVSEFHLKDINEQFESRFRVGGEVDPRVLALSKVYPLVGKKVLEPGCLEGYNTWSLYEMGSGYVTAFDIRSKNVMKTYLRGLAYGSHWDVRLGNVEELGTSYPWLKEEFPYDLLFHAGVFYHLKDPTVHLAQLKGVASHLFLETHTARPGMPLVTLNGYQGHWHKEGGWNEPLSGKDDSSFWLTLDSLMMLWEKAGFKLINHVINDSGHRNGPRHGFLLSMK